jgi:hypothetical protein
MSSVMIPVWMCHNLECLDFCVDMLNGQPVPGKPFVIFEKAELGAKRLDFHSLREDVSGRPFDIHER